MTKTQTFSFEAEDFPFITLREDLTETWNELGLSSLIAAEQEGLKRLLDASGISGQSNFNRDIAAFTSMKYTPHPTPYTPLDKPVPHSDANCYNVLLVKAEGGVPKQVYGPGIFRDGNEIVLKVGDNQAIVIQQGDRLIVGDLKGKITVTTKENSGGNEYPVAQVSFVSPDKDLFKLRVSLESQKDEVSVGEIEAALINEESLWPFLAQVPAQVLRMQDLGIGEWEVRAISSSEGEYGTSYKLHLSNEIVVWARGNSQILLEAGYQMQPDQPLTLVVTAIEEYGDGKFKVDNALRERLPRLEGTKIPAPVTTLEAIVTPVGEVQEDQLDSIPF